jgi:hypothetical protein
MTSVNRNVEGRQTRKVMRYSGGDHPFREHRHAVASGGYQELAVAWASLRDTCGSGVSPFP